MNLFHSITRVESFVRSVRGPSQIPSSSVHIIAKLRNTKSQNGEKDRGKSEKEQETRAIP